MTAILYKGKIIDMFDENTETPTYVKKNRMGIWVQCDKEEAERIAVRGTNYTFEVPNAEVILVERRTLGELFNAVNASTENGINIYNLEEGACDLSIQLAEVQEALCDLSMQISSNN